MPKNIDSFSFHLVSGQAPESYKKLMVNGTLERSPTVTIPTSLYWYICDYLQWIPTLSGSFHRVPFEAPIIGEQGVAIAIRLFSLLRELFVLSPQDVSLTGPYTFISSGDARTTGGGFQSLRFAKEDLISTFDAMIDLTTRASESGALIYWSDLVIYD